MLKTLLQFGADPNVLTLRRKSALKIACQNQQMNIVNILLDHKVLRYKSLIVSFTVISIDSYRFNDEIQRLIY